MISSQTFSNDAHQDWQTVVFKKKPQRYGNTEQDINRARRQDAHIETQKRNTGGSGNNSINTRKVEAENENFHHKKVPSDVAKGIERSRIAKKLSQEALAKALNMQTRDINEIERGQAIYNGQVLSKVKRYLGM